MNADRLLAHYERIADAPDAVPRLRRFILDLAVRGKLIEQDLERRFGVGKMFEADRRQIRLQNRAKAGETRRATKRRTPISGWPITPEERCQSKSPLDAATCET